MKDLNMFDWMDDDVKQTFRRLQELQDAKDRLLLEDLNFKYEKLKEKHAQVENLKYEEALIKCDVIRYISERLGNSSFNIFAYLQGDLLWQAWKWFNYHDKKDDYQDENWDEYEKSFNFVIERVQSSFLSNPKDFELKEVLDYNRNQSTEFRYIYKNNPKKDIIIEIPHFGACNDDNFLDLMRGYRVCYHEYENVISTLAYSWYVDELKQKIDEFISSDLVNKDVCEGE